MKKVRATGVSCAVFLVAWLALVGVVDPLETGIGVAAAVVAAAVAAAIRTRAGFPRLPARLRSWSGAGAPLARIPGDLWRLAALAASRSAPHGRLRTATLPHGTNWREHAERGLAVLVGSAAPNRIVLDVSADGKAVYHELVETTERLLT